jgi:hypothetical protein
VHDLLRDWDGHLRFVPAAGQAVATARDAVERRGTGPELLRLATVVAPQDPVHHRSAPLGSSRYHYILVFLLASFLRFSGQIVIFITIFFFFFVCFTIIVFFNFFPSSYSFYSSHSSSCSCFSFSHISRFYTPYPPIIPVCYFHRVVHFF